MHIALNPNQVKFLVQNSVYQRLKIYEQDGGTDPSAQQPKAGTSSQQSGGQGYPEVGKWESGIERGPANQVAITKWSDVVGSKLTRGKANQLKEQSVVGAPNYGMSYSDTKSMIKVNGDYYKKQSPYIYKEDDGDTFLLNLVKGEFSEALLDARTFLFSGWGLATQLVIGIAGAEIGAPIFLEALDAAIILNDVYIYLTQGIDVKTPEDVENKGSWETFKWQIFNNPDFLRIIEDLLIVLTFGAIRGAQSIYKYFVKNSMQFKRFLVLSRNFFKSIVNTIKKLPNALFQWCKDKIPFLNRIIEYFEKLSTNPNPYKKALGKIPRATVTAAFVTLSMHYGINAMMKLFKVSEEEVKNPDTLSMDFIEQKGEEIVKLSKNDKLVEDELYSYATSEFKNLKRESFRMSTNEKYNKQRVFIINGKKYFINNSGKFQKI